MERQLPPVDDDVFEALQSLTEPLVDDINSVLRRLLELETDGGGEPASEPSSAGHADDRTPDTSLGARSPARAKRPRSAGRSGSKKRKTTKPRAARGTLLPESDYGVPLLRALESFGGSAPASKVIDEVGASLESNFTEADRSELESGLTRWKNRVQFVRLKLVQAGQMKKDSPRGVWEISDAGRDRLKDVDGNK